MRPTRTFDFIVVLKGKTSKTIDMISLLMLSIAVIVFLFNIVVLLFDQSNGFKPKIILYALWILAIGYIAYYKHKQNKNGSEANYRFALMIAAWGWFLMPKAWYLAIVYLIAAFMEKPLKVAPEYAFDEEDIVFNSFPQTIYKWNEISNIVLRFGMLTIDFKNNKIIQGEVNDDVPLQVENDFNEFCKKQLSKHHNQPEAL